MKKKLKYISIAGIITAFFLITWMFGLGSAILTGIAFLISIAINALILKVAMKSVDNKNIKYTKAFVITLVQFFILLLVIFLFGLAGVTISIL